MRHWTKVVLLFLGAIVMVEDDKHALAERAAVHAQTTLQVRGNAYCRDDAIALPASLTYAVVGNASDDIHKARADVIAVIAKSANTRFYEVDHSPDLLVILAQTTVSENDLAGILSSQGVGTTADDRKDIAASAADMMKRGMKTFELVSPRPGQGYTLFVVDNEDAAIAAQFVARAFLTAAGLTEACHSRH